VYSITVVFSLFAYFWLYLIVAVITPDKVDVWEAILTLLMMPLLVVICYLADIGALPGTGGDDEENKSLVADGAEDGKDRPSHPRARKSQAVMNQKLEKAERQLRDAEIGGPGSQESRQSDTTEEQLIYNEETKSPIEKPQGIFTFAADSIDLEVGSEKKAVPIIVYRKNGSKGSVSCKFKTERYSAVPTVDYENTKGVLKFEPGETKQEITITLLPKRSRSSHNQFIVIIDDAEGGAMFNPNDGDKESCILMVSIVNEDGAKSKPQGGSGATLSRLREDFVDTDLVSLGFQMWYDQIKGAFSMEDDDDDDGDGGDDKNEDEEEKENGPPSMLDKFMFGLQLPWNVFYAILSPPSIFCGGWLLFVVAMLNIAGITVFVCDLASLLGCCLKIDDTITAITIVALGTSLPDLFASQTAALEDETADASIVNVTGSNSVNVFLGIGIPWLMCSLFWGNQDFDAADPNDYVRHWIRLYGTSGKHEPGTFVVLSGDLGFAVSVFTSLAIVALVVIRMKRIMVGGELGGPKNHNVPIAAFIIGLWVLYIILSIINAASPDAGEVFRIIAIISGIISFIGGIVFEVMIYQGKITPVIPEEEEEEEEPAAVENQSTPTSYAEPKLVGNPQEDLEAAPPLEPVQQNFAPVTVKIEDAEGGDRSKKKRGSKVRRNSGASDVANESEVIDFQVDPATLAKARKPKKKRKSKPQLGDTMDSAESEEEDVNQVKSPPIRPAKFDMVD